MMRTRRCQLHCLLLVTLLVTQLLGVAHAFEHPALDHTDHACAVCVHGHGSDAVPPPSTVIPVQVQPQHHRTPLSATAVAATDLTGYQSRAPPTLA